MNLEKSVVPGSRVDRQGIEGGLFLSQRHKNIERETGLPGSGQDGSPDPQCIWKTLVWTTVTLYVSDKGEQGGAEGFGDRSCIVKRIEEEDGQERNKKNEAPAFDRASRQRFQPNFYDQTEKELPHPQEDLALGFLMANPDP